MEPTIVVLSPELASQIAAGEVVERPASVVKELIENALDAGATRIDVAIAGGGVGLIEVSDDGQGMSPDNVRRCIERHATSKLRRLSDLDELSSYGFRGEALPSIASVSRLTLRSRTAATDEGTELSTEGGSEPRIRPAAAPVGTTVRVEDLFFNVPARRKFLRSTGTESGHVGDVVLDAALSRPDVSFTFTRDGRSVRNWPRCPSRAARVQQLFAEEELLECEGERGPLTILALLSRPERARQGASGLKVLVNNRPIRDRGLAGTIAHAYGSVLERGRFPRGVIYLDLPPRLVDVNVHPQKVEVRFADPRAVSDALHGIVRRDLERKLAQAPALQRRSAEPMTPLAQRALPHSEESFARTSKSGLRQDSGSLPSWTSKSPPRPSSSSTLPRTATSTPPAVTPWLLRDGVEPSLPRAERPAAPNVSENAPPSPRSASEQLQSASEQLHSAPEQEPARGFDREGQRQWSRLRFLNQVRKTYLLCEGADGLYVLDQHAAAERVVFSNLRRQYDAQSVTSQALLFPLTVSVTPQESELLEAHADQIARVGLDVRVRTSEAVSIHAIPRLLHRVAPERLLRDLMAELSRTDDRAFSDAIDKALATMACHAAVRAGDALTPEEATALLASLDQADFAGYCPHGRPIVTFTSWEELERKVGRR